MPNKPVLVFVHGYLGGSEQWQEQVSFLSNDFHVITPDLPGFGLKNQLEAPQTINSFAQFVLDYVSKLSVNKFHLIGHSMGGMIAQEMTHLAPQNIEKLILYGTGSVGLMPGRFETIDASMRRVTEEGTEQYAKRISSKWFVNGVDSEVYPGCMKIAIQASEQAAIAGLNAMETWSGKEYLSKITTPTLILWGDQDQSYPWQQPETLWREIPNANLSVVAGSSHAVHLEKPQIFNAIVYDFLKTS